MTYAPAMAVLANCHRGRRIRLSSAKSAIHIVKKMLRGSVSVTAQAESRAAKFNMTQAEARIVRAAAQVRMSHGCNTASAANCAASIK